MGFLGHLISSLDIKSLLREGMNAPKKAHLNGSKRNPPIKGFFDPKNVIFLIFQFWPLWGGPLGSQAQGRKPLAALLAVGSSREVGPPPSPNPAPLAFSGQMPIKEGFQCPTASCLSKRVYATFTSKTWLAASKRSFCRAVPLFCGTPEATVFVYIDNPFSSYFSKAI